MTALDLFRAVQFEAGEAVEFPLDFYVSAREPGAFVVVGGDVRCRSGSCFVEVALDMPRDEAAMREAAERLLVAAAGHSTGKAMLAAEATKYVECGGRRVMVDPVRAGLVLPCRGHQAGLAVLNSKYVMFAD